jgi:aminoglycoside/choline kinase family phosphotransferase
MSEQTELQNLYFVHFGVTPEAIHPLKGDGSERRIYRLIHADQSVIGIAGSNRAENRAFIYFSQQFKKYGLPVPDIYCHNLAKGIYLEEDLGNTTLCDVMANPDSNDHKQPLELYRLALQWLPLFQIVTTTKLDYSYCYQHDQFARDSMMWDLTYFQERFLHEFFKLPIDKKKLFKDFDSLTGHLLEEDNDYFLYRDFQSRNIMVQRDQVRFIDYQSGRRGALQYDVAALLYDANVTLTEEIREELLEHYLKQVTNILVGHYDLQHFKKYYYGFVLIRLMQALGAFGFLSIVKGKKDFMKSIPNALVHIETLLHKNTILNSLPTLRSILGRLVDDAELRAL